MTVIGAVQPSDFSEPSAHEVRALIDQLRATRVPAIFGSEVFPSPVLAQVARETGVRYVDKLRVGNVVVNDSTDYWEAHEPFGGASGTQSGWGRIGGRYTMLDMSDPKTVVLDVGGLE